MAIPDSDPRARELDAAFQAAVNGPAKPRAEAKTPAEVDREAPFGREDDGTPKTPHGTNKDGSVRRTAAGRRPKEDQPRVGKAAEPDAKAPKAKPEPHDWTADLDGFADTVWLGMSFTANAGPKIPILGRLLPGDKIGAEAFLFAQAKPRLVAAVNLAAQHNAKAAAFCRRLEGGDGLWALSVMFMVAPVVTLAATIWKGDEKELAEAELPPLAEMAAKNNAMMDAMIARIGAQIEAATTAAAAAAAAAPEQAAAAA